MGMVIIGNIVAGLILVTSLTAVDAIMESGLKLSSCKLISDMIAGISFALALIISIEFINSIAPADNYIIGYTAIIVYFCIFIAYAYAYIIVCGLAKERRRQYKYEEELAKHKEKWDRIFDDINLSKNQASG